AETLEYVFNVMISGGKLPDSLREHPSQQAQRQLGRLHGVYLGADLLLIYRIRRESVTYTALARTSSYSRQRNPRSTAARRGDAASGQSRRASQRGWLRCRNICPS